MIRNRCAHRKDYGLSRAVLGRSFMSGASLRSCLTHEESHRLSRGPSGPLRSVRHGEVPAEPVVAPPAGTVQADDVDGHSLGCIFLANAVELVDELVTGGKEQLTFDTRVPGFSSYSELSASIFSTLGRCATRRANATIATIRPTPAP